MKIYDAEVTLIIKRHFISWSLYKDLLCDSLKNYYLPY